ncbi:hypothetical protein FQN57_006450, partial [Myotisia sp. PD_48]
SHTTASLSALETDGQRQVLDIVTQLRKCGLESILSLPQLVVCGDQSAGKSSVLEALTEIPFPRNDNLCTRFATKIVLRRAPTNSLIVKVIPDPERPTSEQEKIGAFGETIINFDELPDLVAKGNANQPSQAFAKDTLCITIEGPQRPQLTVVDLPGIVQSETKDTSQEDVALVSEITKYYISQPRTICLAIISATHDYANQEILSKVRKFDKKGERTLGVITKPDRLSPGSGSEEAFISLASNEDISFKLGWHVLKNRSFEESLFCLAERNKSEMAFFQMSNFNKLPPETLGIQNLGSKISDQNQNSDSVPDLFAKEEEIPLTEEEGGDETKSTAGFSEAGHFKDLPQEIAYPRKMTYKRAMVWVKNQITRSRGRELSGNFNPLVIGELFWEQSSR